MKDVFDAYPHINTLYIVDGMPFLEQGSANNHAKVTGKEIKIVERASENAAEAKAAKDAAAAEAKAAKDAAAAEAKAAKDSAATKKTKE